MIYFSWIRENIGKNEENIEVPENIKTIKELIEWLKTKGEEYKQTFENAENIKVAIDQEHVKHETTIKNAKEIALFPPMSGG